MTNTKTRKPEAPAEAKRYLTERGSIKWADLLETALTLEGSFGSTYSRFYNYSFGNCILLYSQGVNEPVATYNRWLELGRQPVKGSEKRWVLRPQPVKITNKDDPNKVVRQFVRFYLAKGPIPYSETEGPELPPYEPPEWSLERAAAALDIERVPFQMLNGNVQGYSVNRTYALNPMAADPVSTGVHELAHIVLGHTSKETYREHPHRGINEYQAEGTAFLVLHELDPKGQWHNPGKQRAYIQHWLSNPAQEAQVSEAEFNRATSAIFKAAETILTAGRPATTE